jgi:hypothetical protein
LTVAELVCVRHEFVETGESQLMTATLDENLAIDVQFGPRQHRWIGYVRPIAGLGWSTNGDSGALVYALKNSVEIPLGIHIRKPSIYGGRYGAFVSLEAYLLAAQDKNLALHFWGLGVEDF